MALTVPVLEKVCLRQQHAFFGDALALSRFFFHPASFLYPLLSPPLNTNSIPPHPGPASPLSR